MATPPSTRSRGSCDHLRDALGFRRPSVAAHSQLRDSVRCRTSRCGSFRIAFSTRLRATDMLPIAAIQPPSRAGRTPHARGCVRTAALRSRESREASFHRPGRQQRDGSQRKPCTGHTTKNSGSRGLLDADRSHRPPQASQPPCSTGKLRGCRRTRKARWFSKLVSVGLSDHTSTGSLRVCRHDCPSGIAVLDSDNQLSVLIEAPLDAAAAIQTQHYADGLRKRGCTCFGHC
jgi:hypothetical protein